VKFSTDVVLGKERSLNDAEYCQLVRRYPPSSLLPHLCSISSEIGLAEWSARVDGVLVTPWAVADIARVSLGHGNEYRGVRATRRNAVECVAAYNDLDDPDLMRGDPGALERFLLRTSAQQFDFQQAGLHEIARVVAMCTDAKPVRPPEVMAGDWDTDLLGCRLSEYVAIGQFILASQIPNQGRFDIAYFGIPDLVGAIGSLPLASIEAVYRRHFVTDRGSFKQELRPNDRAASYRRFTYNPLLSTPLIAGLAEHDYFPVAALMVRKLSPAGLYHQGVQRWGNAFARDLGDLFEQYVGLNLRLCPGLDVHPEITYNKGQKRSVDWIVVTPSAVLLVEAKSVRPTEAVRVGGEEAGQELRRMLNKASEQIDRTSEQIEQRQPAFARIRPDLPRVGVIATMGDFHIANAVPIRDYIRLTGTTPSVVASISELEHAVVSDVDLGELILGIVNEGPASGRSVKQALVGRKAGRNPIIDKAWRSGPLAEFTARKRSVPAEP
jgi:hypothetical protein